MIGGIDTQIPTQGNGDALVVAVRAIRQSWSRSVFENGLTGERYDRYRYIPFIDVEELFVYRDAASADAWDAEGAVPSLYNTMVHLIAEDEMITIVVDEKDAAMEKLIAAIESGLSDDIHYIRARLAA